MLCSIVTILAVIGFAVAVAGEPIGIVGLVPLIVTGILHEIKQSTNEKKQS